MRFGRLQVKEFVGLNKFHKALWRCECDCGNEVVALAACLKNRHTQSCGCLHDEIVKVNCKTHGLRHHPLYQCWLNMKDRILNPNNSHYRNYGGRGIDICDEWKHDFKAFYDWAISNGWQKGLTIERLDVNGWYSPANCTWIPFSLQARNKSNNIVVYNNGERYTVAEVAQMTGIKPTTLYSCHNRHGSILPTLKIRGFYNFSEEPITKQ